MQIFHKPFNDLSSRMDVRQYSPLDAQDCHTWFQLEYTAGSCKLPSLAPYAQMQSQSSLFAGYFPLFVRTLLASLALSAASSASAPQQSLVCFSMLPVEHASLVSKYCRTFTLHVHAPQGNSCTQHPSISRTVSIGSKNAYTGDVHSLCRRAVANGKKPFDLTSEEANRVPLLVS